MFACESVCRSLQDVPPHPLSPLFVSRVFFLFHIYVLYTIIPRCQVSSFRLTTQATQADHSPAFHSDGSPSDLHALTVRTVITFSLLKLSLGHARNLADRSRRALNHC